MTQAARFAAISVLLGTLVIASRAAAAEARVYLQSSVTSRGEHAGRLIAELQSDGYDVEWQPRNGRSPCEPMPRATLDPPDRRTSVWLDLASDSVSGELLLSICYVAPRARPERALLRVPADDPKRLALATVEALNGLAARPKLVPKPVVVPRSVERHAPGAGVRLAALFVDAALALDVAGGRPLVGAVTGLEAALGERLSLELETFVPVRETTARGTDRELSLNIAWARLGPSVAWVVSPLRLGLSLQGGAALVWASAETTPPLIGTTEHTASAMLSAGAWLECPDTSLFYFRAAGRGSRLIPSIELELGSGATRSFGELLVEMNIGVGVRWDTVR